MRTEELTRTVALYQNTANGWTSITSYSDGEKDSHGYVRISEPVTITFSERKRDEVMTAIVAGIDAKIVEAQQAVRNLEQRKAELLALPAPA